MKHVARWVIGALCAAGCGGRVAPDDLSSATTGPTTAMGATTTGGGGSGPSVDACIVQTNALKTCQTIGCHLGDRGVPVSGGLDLSPTSVTTNAKALLDKPNIGTEGVTQTGNSVGCPPASYKLIDSRYPLDSLIYLKLRVFSEPTPPPCGAKMPLIGTFRTDDKACVLRWIDSVIALP
jgi:hypothetical protein